jgi:GNAT superfamily N-acetyltransferase
MAATDPAAIHITPLAETELRHADALVREAGWNQLDADWRIFCELGTVDAVRSPDGRVIATAATLPYGSFAWISMVLVAGEYRRRGLATRLLRHCVDNLTGRDLIPILDATAAGRDVYAALGFEDCWGYHRLVRSEARASAAPPAPDGVTIAPITDADWPALCACDEPAFGADRSRVLGRLRRRLPAAELVARRDGHVVGFLLGRDGRTAAHLGPLVAEDESVAVALLARSLPALEGTIYVDLADDKAATRAWLGSRGFAPERPLTRMLHRRRESFDDRSRVVAVAGPELG